MLRASSNLHLSVELPIWWTHHHPCWWGAHLWKCQAAALVDSTPPWSCPSCFLLFIVCVTAWVNWPVNIMGLVRLWHRKKIRLYVLELLFCFHFLLNSGFEYQKRCGFLGSRSLQQLLTRPPQWFFFLGRCVGMSKSCTTSQVKPLPRSVPLALTLDICGIVLLYQQGLSY